MDFVFHGVSVQNKRQSNMDSLLLKNGRINKKNILLATICDGVGNMAEGAFASGVLVWMLNDWFEKLTTTDWIGLKLRDIVLEINLYIISEAKRRSIRTASTLSALLLVEDNYYIVHTGDSRIYGYESGELSVLTKDDISKSGKLTSCIGQTEDVLLQYSEGLIGNKTFLLCSDGLYKKMDIYFMIDRLNSLNKHGLKEAAQSLIKHVMKCGEEDNITLALIKIERKDFLYEN